MGNDDLVKSLLLKNHFNYCILNKSEKSKRIEDTVKKLLQQSLQEMMFLTRMWDGFDMYF